MNLPAPAVTSATTNQHLHPPSPLPNPTPNTTKSGGPNFQGPPKNSLDKANDSSFDPLASWTSSIARQCQKGHLSAAAVEFKRMRVAGIEPNHITFVTLLSGCSRFPAQASSFGASIHGYARKIGLDVDNVMVGTALIDMYAKFGEMGLSRLCFESMIFRNKVSWNTLIDGYMRNGYFEEAINLFDEMPERDVISWTALINGFVKKECFEEALVLFQEMQLSRVQPDHVVIVSILSAIANLGTLGLGMWVHRFGLKHGYVDNVRVTNSLVDMYCRCGYVDLACQVFERMGKRTVVSWNCVISGLAMNGHAEESLKYFNLMQKDGFEPDEVSFTGALTACSHAGLANEGVNLFQRMRSGHKITPRMEHYGCLVDLYSRAGKVEDALQVVQEMPMKPNGIVLGSLLSACKKRGDLRLAERLMKKISELDPGVDSNHVMLSNIFATLGSWQGASIVRRKMKLLGIEKRPGISSIEVNCLIHEFMAGDKSHLESENIYTMLELLSFELRACGYTSEIDITQ